MKVICTKNELIKGMQLILPIISSKITLPILSNFLIETEKNRIKLTATDLEIGLICYIDAEIEENGKLTIPAKRFFDIIKEVSESEIEIQSDEQKQIKVKAGKSKFLLVGLDVKDFPVLPEIKKENIITINTQILKLMLQKTIYAASKNSDRYALQGTFIGVENGLIEVVATDGKRLSFVTAKNNDKKQKVSAIIPTKSVLDILRLLSINEDIKEVKLYISDNLVSVIIGTIIFQSKLIEAQFPDYKKIIVPQKQVEAKIKLNVEETISAVRQMALICETTSINENNFIKLNFTKNKMNISANSSNGFGEVVVDIEYSGPQFDINLNPIFLKNILENVYDKNIFFEYRSSKDLVMFLPEENKNEKYIVMPIFN